MTRRQAILAANQGVETRITLMGQLRRFDCSRPAAGYGRCVDDLPFDEWCTYCIQRAAAAELERKDDQLAAERRARERLERALSEIVGKRPKGEKPEWGDGHGGCNFDDAESNGYDICAWGCADIAEAALLRGAGEPR